MQISDIHVCTIIRKATTSYQTVARGIPTIGIPFSSLLPTHSLARSFNHFNNQFFLWKSRLKREVNAFSLFLSLSLSLPLCHCLSLFLSLSLPVSHLVCMDFRIATVFQSTIHTCALGYLVRALIHVIIRGDNTDVASSSSSSGSYLLTSRWCTNNCTKLPTHYHKNSQIITDYPEYMPVILI